MVLIEVIPDPLRADDALLDLARAGLAVDEAAGVLVEWRAGVLAGMGDEQ